MAGVVRVQYHPGRQTSHFGFHDRIPRIENSNFKTRSVAHVVGGPPRVPWVSTGRILDEFGGDRNGYRRYVESGKGEKAISPFERAVAGLVLGSAAFVSKVKERLVERSSSPLRANPSGCDDSDETVG